MSIISSTTAQKIIHSQLVSLVGFLALNYLLVSWISIYLWYASAIVLCASYVAFNVTRQVKVWVKRQSSPEHIQRILKEGFDAPHNEESLINELNVDKNTLGQRGLDRVSFSGPFFCRCWEAMLSARHDELETLWVKVRLADLFVSQVQARYALSFLYKTYGTGVEYTAERGEVNGSLATAVIGKDPPQKAMTYLVHALLVVGALWTDRLSFVQTIQASINATQIAYHTARAKAIARKTQQNNV